MKTAVLRTTRLPSAPRPAASSFQVPLHAIAGTTCSVADVSL